jgi:hypothetical protein
MRHPENQHCRSITDFNPGIMANQDASANHELVMEQSALFLGKIDRRNIAPILSR